MQLIAKECIFRNGDDRRFAVFTLQSLDALLSLFTGVAFFPLEALFSGFSLESLDTLFSFFTGVALFSLRTLNPLLPLGTRTAPVPFRSDGAGVSPHTLKPDLSDITLGSRVAADTLGASWTHRTCSTPGTGRSRTALLPLNAPGAHGPPLSPRLLFSARAFRAHRSLNRHIGPAAWVRLAAAAPAGSGIVIHKQHSSCCRLLFHRMRPLPKCPVLFPVF